MAGDCPGIRVEKELTNADMRKLTGVKDTSCLEEVRRGTWCERQVVNTSETWC